VAMSSDVGSNVSSPTRVLFGAGAVAAAILIAGAVITVSPRQAQAWPKYAKQTKLPCGKCHVNPAGGGPRNDFGNAFEANGFKLKP
jgi:hypothetical protein